MSKLKEKSEFNIDAAEMLIENSLYAPSVHCSYYSCFQLLKYTMNDFFDISYDNLSRDISSSPLTTHRYVIKYISTELVSFVGRSESERNFTRKIKDLKHFREESDYENLDVDYDKGTQAFELAKNLRRYLITNFNL